MIQKVNIRNHEITLSNQRSRNRCFGFRSLSQSQSPPLRVRHRRDAAVEKRLFHLFRTFRNRNLLEVAQFATVQQKRSNGLSDSIPTRTVCSEQLSAGGESGHVSTKHQLFVPNARQLGGGGGGGNDSDFTMITSVPVTFQRSSSLQSRDQEARANFPTRNRETSYSFPGGLLVYFESSARRFKAEPRATIVVRSKQRPKVKLSLELQSYKPTPVSSRRFQSLVE